MSDEWDFYFARVNDAVSSIFVDLGIRPHVPIETRPWLLWVWVEMQAPRADGLASREESPTLGALEEALEAMVAPACGAQLVGRITGVNRREFYFHASEPGELDAAVDRAMQPFDTYRYQTGSTFQPDWDHYLNLLYPSASNWRRMQNRRALAALREQGDVHETPRAIEHWFGFESETGRDACRDTLMAIEFSLEGESLLDDPSVTHPFGLVMSRIDSIDAHTINGITLELDRLAGEHGGRYEGWESPVIPGDASN